MDETEGQAKTPQVVASPPGSVARLANLVVAVYENADADLRTAVGDALLAGIPASTLNSNLSQRPNVLSRLTV